MSELHVTFICSGNICRSPMAEKMFAHQLAQRGLAERVRVSSAGTGGWHIGSGADERAVAVLRGHGYPSEHRAAQMDDEHLSADLVIALGRNHERLLRQAGVDPVTAAIPAAVSGMGTIGQFALPASMGSNAASLPARVASRGLQGAAINVPAGVVQTQVDNSLLPAAARPTMTQDPLDPASLFANAAGGLLFGQMGGKGETFRAPNRAALSPTGRATVWLSAFSGSAKLASNSFTIGMSSPSSQTIG